MSALGLNLLLALVVLAPGFGLHFAVFGPRRSLFRSPPPAPNSISALAVVTLGAVASHAVAACLLVLNDALAGLPGLPHLALPFDPDIYRVALAAAHQSRSLDERGLASLLAFSLLLTAATYGVALAALRSRRVSGQVARSQFGWAAQLPHDAGEDRVVIAFVLTDTDIDGVNIGYEGVLLDVGLDADKSIRSILLAEASLFHMRHWRGQVRRIVDGREDLIELLHVEGAHVRNVAFNVIDIAPA